MFEEVFHGGAVGSPEPASRGLPRLELAHSAAELLQYRMEDDVTCISVRFDGETAWLTLAQLATLFQRDKSVVLRHIKNLFAEGELVPETSVARAVVSQREGEREVVRELDHYNLDVIISVGYRVRSRQATQFRIWATQRLRELLIQGFSLEHARLRQRRGAAMEELLARIREIRASEKAFSRKMLDLYATSIDYDPGAEVSQRFFATVQNKLHWAAHGHTAAEIIAIRADASRPHMGLTAWAKDAPRKADALVAKNYLGADELETLHRLVTAFLEVATLQALHGRPMRMADWSAKLDELLRLCEREVLTHDGVISSEQAAVRASQEYERFVEQRGEPVRPRAIERRFPTLPASRTGAALRPAARLQLSFKSLSE